MRIRKATKKDGNRGEHLSVIVWIINDKKQWVRINPLKNTRHHKNVKYISK